MCLCAGLCIPLDLPGAQLQGIVGFPPWVLVSEHGAPAGGSLTPVSLPPFFNPEIFKHVHNVS